MAFVVVTLRIMPESVDTDLKVLEEKASDLIKKFGGDPGKTAITPIAFGLKSLDIFFVMQESVGSTEELEKQIAALDGVNSAEAIDVRRAIG
ncbi:MAG: elongation factor 1-beta [Candidatus Woesearchaeota archaeon]|nr:elongation factor 1-beta [Candidatus Woesearchaeota archaeon]